MEFALSENNQRISAIPHIKGFCPICKTPMIPKCGKVYANHWAHKSRSNCDPWWENETQWHRQWKENVHTDFREVVIEKNGVKHIADVQLPSGIIFEFQRYPLSIDERQAREKFYDKMIWVILFPRDKILEIKDRKKYVSLYGDQYVKVKSFSEGFFRHPHACPIFLDFNDGEMFRITEFDDYDNMRVKWFYGKFIKKTDFVNEYLKAPFLSDIEHLKISHYHQDIENKYGLLLDAQRQLEALKSELSRAKGRLLLIKKQKWYPEGSLEWVKLDIMLREDGYYDEDSAGRAFYPFQCPKCKRWYYSIDAYRNHKKMCLN